MPINRTVDTGKHTHTHRARLIETVLSRPLSLSGALSAFQRRNQRNVKSTRKLIVFIILSI